MERSVPSKSVSTGFEVETRSLTWTIDGYPFIRTCDSMIDSQKVDFTAGETTGRQSKWTVILDVERQGDGRRWIGIFLKLRFPISRRALNARFTTFHAGIRFTVRNKEGEIIKDKDTGPKQITEEFLGGGLVGFQEFIDADDADFCPEESLEIHTDFKLYSPCKPKTTSSLEVILEKFQVKFLDQLRNDFAEEMETPIASTSSDFKILSKDKKEFSMQKWILAARSEVFAGMLRANMTEANSGVLELPDISSQALEVFLHFLSTGVLLPEWSQTEVIVELTNVAAKYQIKDLLQFFDVAMGKVCQLQNVGALLTLARHLSLKVAEEELMMFVRKKGMGSADNFIKMWNTELPMLDCETTSDAGEKDGRKRKRGED